MLIKPFVLRRSRCRRRRRCLSSLMFLCLRFTVLCSFSLLLPKSSSLRNIGIIFSKLITAVLHSAEPPIPPPPPPPPLLILKLLLPRLYFRPSFSQTLPFSPGGYSLEFSVGVCRQVVRILTLFQIKSCYFPHPFSDLAPVVQRVDNFIHWISRYPE